MYLFDSDALTAIEKGNLEMFNFLGGLEQSNLALSILTVYEYEFSIANMPNAEDRADQRRFMDRILVSFQLIPLTLEDAKIFGGLKKKFYDKTGIKQNALKRHTVDLAIASVAITNDFTLVSRDKIFANHLQELDTRLQVIDWASLEG